MSLFTRLIGLLIFMLYLPIAKANFFVEVAKEHGLHPLVLYAIAQQESTRPGYGKPWPWTANFNGKGVYFESKMQAVEAVNQAFQRGERNVDVGVMQINLRWHGHHFASINQAFDPLHNIRVAARVLKQYQSDPLRLQIAKYHCPRAACRERASQYADKVVRRLNH